ncbi:MAG: hypothetical protein KDD73_06485 [Anaerolineales bacterium]|nr:hypothetical protein [Anaerolineales bacterium]MCB9172657.1 hypothetical protein [Ardenticatenales bacterium]
MSTKYSTYVDGEEFAIAVNKDGSVAIDGETVSVDMLHIANNVIYSMIAEGRSSEVYASLEDGAWRILLDGQRYEVIVEDERTKQIKSLQRAAGGATGDTLVKAPMPGLVIKVLVEVGEHIAVNAPLLILEAMKMENEIRAPREGIVKEIRVEAGKTVELQQPLLILGDPEAEKQGDA